MKYPKMMAMAAFLMCALPLTGCIDLSQPHRRIDHYILEYPSPAMAPRPRTDATIRVARFRVAPAYDSTRIFFSAREPVRNAYHYHRWRAHPGDLTAHCLARDLRQSGLFSGVSVQSPAQGATHLIQGLVEDFYQDSLAESPAAVLTLTVSLLQADETDGRHRLLFQKTYPVREACRDRTVAALAQAMSRAMGRISASVVADVYDRLARAGG